ncbi:hypothetical protein ACWER9_06510 [Micromonospora sp. NPDC003944]
MATLRESTHVRHPETGELAFLIAGGDVPEWASPLVGEHLIDGVSARPGSVASAPEDPAAEVVRLQARINVLKAAIPSSAAGEGADAAGRDGPPPKGGAGSGAPTWREYAAKKGVDVAEDASREDVIAALEAAGVPTE